MKATPADKVAQEGLSTELVGKKRRGRPIGSKNKSKRGEVALVEAVGQGEFLHFEADPTGCQHIQKAVRRHAQDTLCLIEAQCTA